MKLDTTCYNSINRTDSGQAVFTWKYTAQRTLKFMNNIWTTHLLRLDIKRERKTLSRLTDRELADIGISRSDAHRESKRSFSDLPDSRKPSKQ